VVGSDTGKRYRIRRGAAMNIEELAADGYVTRRWCFAPEGASAIGDVMLAQKIALETFELEALVPRHSDYDWLILSQSRMGKSSGGTRIWMLLATPG
jgi:hypothetical protein